MNRELWNDDSYYENSIPNWPCPTCGIGTLQSQKGKTFREETATSKADQKWEDWEPEMTRYIFTSQLRCNNSKCKDFVIVVGSGDLRFEMDNNFKEKTFIKFSPSFFKPALHLISIPEKCPEPVRNEILKAFSLYWSDISSCGNKIRVAIEQLMDVLKVKKWEKKNSGSTKERKIELHRRIELFRTKQPDIADHLLAIKWIGNAGTHVGNINRGDILNGFELLEYSLERIYEKKEERLNQIAAKVNKRRGPIHS